LIRQALKEDRAASDITTRALIPAQQRSTAELAAKQTACVCGLRIVQKIFQRLNPRVKLTFFCRDGERVQKGKVIARLKGRTQAILKGERVALNFLSRLSGIATLTFAFTSLVKHYPVVVLDTGKTTPGLRALEKWAVRCGGGQNHRFDLQSMALIKDNHIAAAKKAALPDLVKQVKNKTRKPLEVEVTNLKQLREVLFSHPDIILLDNMSLQQMRLAVHLNRAFYSQTKKKILLEASGKVTLKNVRSIARTGVDRISVGALTHSAPSIDFSLEIVK